MSRWDETVEFTRRLLLAPDAEAISSELLAHTSQYGLTRLIAGTIPTPGLSTADQKSHILFSGWPEAWMRRYVALSYACVDPILRQVVANRGMSFGWHEIQRHPEREKESQRIMNEAREPGLAAGFAVPMVTLEGDLATVLRRCFRVFARLNRPLIAVVEGPAIGFGAEEAKACGLVTEIVACEPRERALAIARRFARMPADALRTTRQLMRADPTEIDRRIDLEVAACRRRLDDPKIRRRVALFATAAQSANRRLATA